MKTITLLFTTMLFFCTLAQSQVWDWTHPEPNGNLDPNSEHEDPHDIEMDAAGNVYVAGNFTDTSGKYYVAKWNGTEWSQLGTGTNALNANSAINNITTDANGNVYASGNFTNSSGKQYLAQWNGTTWSELGIGAKALNANGNINSVTMEAANNNIYATGNFINSAGRQYVAKWNGTMWYELGMGTNEINNAVNSIAVDQAGNLYAGGAFKNSGGKNYVARYGITK